MKERAAAAPNVVLYPTAWQDVDETQDTPLSPPTPEGRVSCDQVVPLKEKAVPAELPPTAWQNVDETQDTPLS